MTQKEKQRRCSVCGAELPAMTPQLCPKCLLKAGLSTQTEKTDNPAAAFCPERSAEVKLSPGDNFGHYRIEQLLGQGGMGAVYAAEDLENGRRVALKIMSHKLDSPEARARFLREGRLAASITHPNSVYIYGTEEVAGIPVIAMELMHGGTLQDRVRKNGPLPVNESVDCILQIVDGLEAAQEVGILHRDVKPSNCFTDDHGAVKIGDFGLSISTTIRLEPIRTGADVILGTPAFSSPEQLRGDELTVRSDIYAVGVTLYYLLTGKMPFEAKTMPQLIAQVIERAPESPSGLRSEIPAELSKIILHCLEKNPERRYGNYAELRKALPAYSSTAMPPAPLAKRLLAGIIDHLILSPCIMLINFLSRNGFSRFPASTADYFNDMILPIMLILIVELPYYGFLEGLKGASIGKLLCGLRVMKLDRTLPGIRSALFRAAVVLLLPQLLNILLYLPVAGIESYPLPKWVSALFFVSILIKFLPFVTMRRRNGFAGLHDLATGTRVVQKPAYAPRPVQQPTAATALSASAAKNNAGARCVSGFWIWLKSLGPRSLTAQSRQN